MYFSASEGRFPLAQEEPPDTALDGASSSFRDVQPDRPLWLRRACRGLLLQSSSLLGLRFATWPGLVLVTGTESSEAPGLPVEIVEGAASSSAGAADGSESAADSAMLADLRVRLPACDLFHPLQARQAVPSQTPWWGVLAEGASRQLHLNGQSQRLLWLSPGDAKPGNGGLGLVKEAGGAGSKGATPEADIA
eukprot:s4298_g4.t1